MPLETRLDLRLTQKLILTPQLQLAIKLLQLTQLELSQLLNQELTENPLLEESSEEQESGDAFDGEPESDATDEDIEAPFGDLFKFGVDEYFDERSSDGRDLGYFSPGLDEQPSFELFHTKKPSLYEHLLWQLRLSDAPDETRKAAELLIGNIDEDGYLKITDEEIASMSGANLDTIKDARVLVQDFDPTGIGARDLKECLLLQIKSLNLNGTPIEKIINNNLEDLHKRKYGLIAKLYEISIEDVVAALKIIKGLDPCPGRRFSSDETVYIVPDVYIFKRDGEYEITLNDDGMPRLRLNNNYRRLLQRKEQLSKEEKNFLKEKMKSAVELIKGLEQRSKTIYKVSESILLFQREFFDRGVQHLKPLTLRDIAAEIKMHESTISRVTSNKFLACSHGVFSFKYFFSSSIHSAAGDMSSTSVKDLIKKIVTGEDANKPLSDKDIVDKLKGFDIKIARRTVAKYRDELKIPQQNRRKRDNF